jgi:hypothetical protein
LKCPVFQGEETENPQVVNGAFSTSTHFVPREDQFQRLPHCFLIILALTLQVKKSRANKAVATAKYSIPMMYSRAKERNAGYLYEPSPGPGPGLHLFFIPVCP